jgi:hypothetical protein
LDTDSALQSAMWFEERDSINGRHSLHFHPSVDREAVLARGRIGPQASV